MRNGKWVPVTTKEMYAFLGVIQIMSLVDLPAEADYWSLDPVLGCPSVRNLMVRDRFRPIKRALAVANPDAATNAGDRLPVAGPCARDCHGQLHGEEGPRLRREHVSGVFWWVWWALLCRGACGSCPPHPHAPTP